eukprot:3277497-Rhodomonas_salina.1
MANKSNDYLYYVWSTGTLPPKLQRGHSPVAGTAYATVRTSRVARIGGADGEYGGTRSRGLKRTRQVPSYAYEPTSCHGCLPP